MKKIIGFFALLALVSSLSSCGYMVSEDDALAAAKRAGLKDVSMKSAHQLAPTWNGCSDSDSAGFKVTGVNGNGERVDAVVCCGALFKGCTIRY